MMLGHKKIQSKQRGFSLIEGLVAFLILSIGMLGIASLQLISLKAGRTAEIRTIAVIKAEEILERIRTNQPAVMSYFVLANDPGTDHTCDATKLCNSAEMARDDIFNWKADLMSVLPNNANTTASIDVVEPVPGVMPAAIVTVTINWQERNPETKTMDNMSYSVESHICNILEC